MKPYMIMQKLFLLLEANPVIVGGTQAAAVATEAAEIVGAADPAPAGGMFSSVSVLLIYAAIIGALYFFMFRPQRKRDKEMKQMQENIRIGDNVVTTAGFFGKIVALEHPRFIMQYRAKTKAAYIAKYLAAFTAP